MSLPDYIFPGAFVRLRNGAKGRIYATDGEAGYPVHGASYVGGEWSANIWAGSGSFRGDPLIDGLDIVGPWVDKPDCSKLWPILPPWIKWVAMDNGGASGGAWFGYEDPPERSHNHFSTTRGICIVIPNEYAPTFTGDWKDSLCERPRA